MDVEHSLDVLKDIDMDDEDVIDTTHNILLVGRSRVCPWHRITSHRMFPKAPAPGSRVKMRFQQQRHYEQVTERKAWNPGHRDATVEIMQCHRELNQSK